MIRFWRYAAFLIAFYASSAGAIEIRDITSQKGHSAWLTQDHILPIVSMSFSFEGGKYFDPLGKEGAADMLSAILTEGAGEYDGGSLRYRIEELGMQIDFEAESDYFSGSLRCLREKCRAAFSLLGLILTEPRLDKESIERLRRAMLAGYEHEQQDPDSLASRLWWRENFKNHPYGRFEDKDSIARIERKDLESLLQKTLATKLHIGISGDVEWKEAAIYIDAAFGKIKKQN